MAPDTWPGDPAVGQRLLVGELLARGSAGAVAPESDDPPWRRAGAPALWLDALNGFGWLRDLRDCGDPVGRRARRPPGRRLDRTANGAGRPSPGSATCWPSASSPGSATTTGWPTAADPGFAARFVFSLARQRTHLRRALRTGLVGHEAVAALKALIFADLAFLRDGKRFEKSLEQTLSRLAKFVKRYVLHDGIVAERAPHLQLAVLRHLLDVRAALGVGRAPRAGRARSPPSTAWRRCCASSATATAGWRCSTAPGRAIAR